MARLLSPTWIIANGSKHVFRRPMKKGLREYLWSYFLTAIEVYLCWLAKIATLRKIAIFVWNLSLRKLKEYTKDNRLTRWCKLPQPLFDIHWMPDSTFVEVILIRFMTLPQIIWLKKPYNQAKYFPSYMVNL